MKRRDRSRSEGTHRRVVIQIDVEVQDIELMRSSHDAIDENAVVGQAIPDR
jgi:hypothetical protein